MHFSSASTLAALTLLSAVSATPVVRRNGNIIAARDAGTPTPIHIHIKDTNDDNIEWIDVSGGDGTNPLKIKIAIIETNQLNADVLVNDEAVTGDSTNQSATTNPEHDPSASSESASTPSSASDASSGDESGVESNHHTVTSTPFSATHHCVGTTYRDTTSSSAPLASDCAALADHVAALNKEYHLSWSSGGFYRLLTYKTCTFGYSTHVHSGTNVIGSVDISNAIYESLGKGWEREGRLSVKGEMSCNGHELIWGFTSVGSGI